MGENDQTGIVEKSALEQALLLFPTSQRSASDEDRLSWLKSQNQLFLLLLEGISDAVMVLRPDGFVTFLNNAAQRLLGLNRKDAQQMLGFECFCNAKGKPRINRLMRLLSRKGEIRAHRVFVRNQDGLVIPVELNLSRLEDQGLTVRYLAIFRDLTSYEKQQRIIRERVAELREIAQTDSLTGCFNRHWLHMNYSEFVGQAARAKKRVAIVFVDLDEFKGINDTYTHPVGDQVLHLVATAIKREVRQGDIVVRYGGDEFLVLLMVDAYFDAITVADRVLARIRSLKYADLTGAEHGNVTASLGVAVVEPAQAADMAKLVRFASGAQKAAKKNGKNCVTYYEDLDASQAESEREEADDSATMPGESTVH
jgi:diguanylate cyclase (GGDEF)-like protein/PAS domain S-box-containing protein